MRKFIVAGLVSFGSLLILCVLAGAVVVPSTALEDEAKQTAPDQTRQCIETLHRDERRLADVLGKLEEDEKEITRLTETPGASSDSDLKEERRQLRDVLRELKNDAEEWKRSRDFRKGSELEGR